MKCKKCNYEFENAKFCPECGTPVTTVCENCNTEHQSKFCPECGAPALKNEPSSLPGEQGASSQIAQPAPVVLQAGPALGGDAPVVAAPIVPDVVQLPHEPAAAPPPPQQAYAMPTIIINNSSEANTASSSQNTNANVQYTPHPQQQMASPSNKLLAFLLCLLLGYWGLHYFYVGKVGMGLLYLFTFGLCGIGWLVDLVRILTGSFTDNYGRPLV